MSPSQNDWRSKALCAYTPALQNLAFGDDNDEDEPHSTEDAQWYIDNVCYECPVMVQCARWVDKNPQEFGVFAGLLPSERNVLDSETADHSGTN